MYHTEMWQLWCTTEVEGYQTSSFRKICVSESEWNTNRDIWILAYTEQVDALLAGSNLSLKDKIDDIEVYLMSLEDVCLVYNVQTTNVTKVVSFRRPKQKSDWRENVSLYKTKFCILCEQCNTLVWLLQCTIWLFVSSQKTLYNWNCLIPLTSDWPMHPKANSLCMSFVSCSTTKDVI